MNLNKKEEQIILQELLEKFEYGKSYKKYQNLCDGSEIWRRGYLRRYIDSNPSFQRDKERKFFLGLIFRSIEQFAADFKDALFSNNPFFVVRPRGADIMSTSKAELAQSVLDFNTTIPMDYAIRFMSAIRHVLTFGVAYTLPYYDYKEMKITNYSHQMNPQTGEREVFIEDQMKAVADNPDFDVPYPTRVVVDPNTQAGRVNSTCGWYFIERQRPHVWYMDRKELYGYSDKKLREIKNMHGDTSMDTVGPNNLEDNWDIQSSKVLNELEYVGRIHSLPGRFDSKRTYRITILNQMMIIRSDINIAPDGLGLNILNVIPDIDGSHIGIGVADPATDYQKATNEWYNLRMRGLALTVNPMYAVNANALPNWKELHSAPPGHVFPMEGDYDAKKILQSLSPNDLAGNSWEQMVGFTQRDHDLTVGTSASRLGSIESEQRTATELSQVKEGADRRANSMIFTAIRTGHLPTIRSMLKYTLAFWSTPRTLKIINNATQQAVSVLVRPEDIRNADVDLEVIDATGGSIDQQMAFYSNLYNLSLQDPTINRTATLIAMLKNSKIVKNPYDLINVQQGMMNPGLMAEAMGPEAMNFARGGLRDTSTSNAPRDRQAQANMRRSPSRFVGGPR